jgi:hypothetical protein
MARARSASCYLCDEEAEIRDDRGIPYCALHERQFVQYAEPNRADNTEPWAGQTVDTSPYVSTPADVAADPDIITQPYDRPYYEWPCYTCGDVYVQFHPPPVPNSFICTKCDPTPF